MDFNTEIINAVKQIPRINESGISPELDDLILGGRLGMDSFDFAELVIILASATGKDPFSINAPSRETARTLRDLAELYKAV